MAQGEVQQFQLTKITDLPQASTIEGLVTLGVDNGNNSVKVPIELLKGNKGDPGNTPYIGANGNWWINGVDTGQTSLSVPNTKVFYNVSQANNNFAYTDKQTARNAVTANLRGLGQIITYKLTTGWVTEQFTGTAVSGWATESNWKEIGLTKEDLLAIDGIGYKTQTSNPDFINIISTYDYKVGYKIVGDSEMADGNVSYNPAYFEVKSSTKYLHANLMIPSVLFYTDAKVFISQVNVTLTGGSFTTPSNAAYVRYNIYNSFNSGGAYIYEAPTTTQTQELAVKLGVGDLTGAILTDVEISTANILPNNISMQSKGLDTQNVASISNGWYHSETYIPIIGGLEYETNLSSATPFMWFYDAGKRAISYLTGANSGLPYGKFKTPVNAAYLRFNSSTTNVAAFFIKEVAIEEGFYIPNLIVPKENVVDLAGETGTVTEAIPYASDGNSSTTNNFWSYENLSTVRGQLVDSVKVPVANANSTIVVAYCADAAGNSILWQKTFTGLPAGANILEIHRKLGVSEYLCIKGIISYNTTRVNPVGGKIIGGATVSADLCVGINIVKSSTGSVINYISLGDSITFGEGTTLSYAKLLSLQLGGTFTNLGVSGMKCIGSTGLITKVNQVPDAFKGVVTIMIGINDAINNSVLGDVVAVLAKPFASLDANASFAEAFRLCLETLLRKAPNAIVLIIPPLKAKQGIEAKIETYRQVQRDICTYYAIPFTDTFRTCTIAPLTYTRLMPDELHPNDLGHAEIDRVLYPVVKMYLPQ